MQVWIARCQHSISAGTGKLSENEPRDDNESWWITQLNLKDMYSKLEKYYTSVDYSILGK